MYLERTAFNGALASSEKNKNIKHGVLEQLFFIIRFLRVAQKPLHDNQRYNDKQHRCNGNDNTVSGTRNVAAHRFFIKKFI